MTDARDQVQARLDELNQLILDEAARYLASRPLGSFVSIEQLNQAAHGQRVDWFQLSDTMSQTTDRAFWTVKKNMRTVGLFVISADAYREYEKAGNGTR